MFRQAGEICGFLPFQRTGWKTAGPAGGHFTDYQGLVGVNLPWLSPSTILSAARLQALDLDHTLPAATAWDLSGWKPASSPIIRLSGGFSTLIGNWRERSSAWDTLGRKERKLIRERGSWHFNSHVEDPALLELLVAWKRAQYRNTRVRDVLAPPSDRLLLHNLLNSSRSRGHWEVRLSVLRCRDQPIALHLGLHEHGIWHYWFPAYDPGWSAYSPGLLLLREMVKDACSRHEEMIDLGKGNSRYKTEWANDSIPLMEGSLMTPGWVATRRKLSAWAYQTARHAGASRLKSVWNHMFSNFRR